MSDSPAPPAVQPTDENRARIQINEQPASVPNAWSQVDLSLHLAPDTRLELHIETPSDPNGIPILRKDLRITSLDVPPSLTASPSPHPPTPIAPPGWRTRIHHQWQRLAQTFTARTEAFLFGATLVVFLITRLTGLGSFPIFFFTDEAIQTILAQDFLRDNFTNYDGTFLPTYFENGNQYNLSLSVYAQVLPYLLFGRSVEVTRSVNVLAALLGTAAVALILRQGFRSKYWWSAALLLTVTPAWFYHSRTAFETVLSASFFAVFLYGYILYRLRSPRYLYLTIGAGALTFYSYSPANMIMLVAAVLLFFSDLPYHWQNRRWFLRGAVMLLLLALPYLRFVLTHPGANVEHLQILNSYWVQPLPIAEKLSRFGTEYLRSISPSYWFIPNNTDLARHVMKGYGHIFRAMLPFFLIGVVVLLRGIKHSSNRILLAALLAAPSGAALVHVGITRALSFVIPAAILTALGLEACLTWLERRKINRTALSLSVFSLLTLFSITMLIDSLTRGPTWFRDYGLGGMQYGARQVFGEINRSLKTDPTINYIVSPAWANGTDIVARFFLGDPLPIQMGSIDGYMMERKEITPSTVFVMTPPEFEMASQSGKFSQIQVLQILPYPDSSPGFYFVKLQYSDQFDAILAQEKAERRQLKEGNVTYHGKEYAVRYSMLDIGEPAHIFDGLTFTVIRTLEANPLVLDFSFPVPETIQSVEAFISVAQTLVRVTVFQPGSDEPLTFDALADEARQNRWQTVTFDTPLQVERMRVEITNLRDSEPAHVHLWELRWK